MRQCVFVILLLASIGPVSGSSISTLRTRAAFCSQRRRRRRRRLLLNNTLSIRGGTINTAKPYQEVVAKAACVFFMGQSSTAWLAPHRTCLKYGLTTSISNVSCNRKLATAYLGSAVMMYGILFQHCTVNTAVGASAVAWMMEQLKARLFYEAEAMNMPIIGDYLVGAIASLTAHAKLWNTPFATIAGKISACLLLLHGLAFFIAPAGMCRILGIPIGITALPNNKKQYATQVKEHNEAVFLHRYMGVALVFSGLMQSVLVWTEDIYAAIGTAFGCLFLVNCWSFLKTSDFKRLARSSLSVSSKFDWKKRIQKLFFPVFNAMVASSLLLGGNGITGTTTTTTTVPVVP